MGAEIFAMWFAGSGVWRLARTLVARCSTYPCRRSLELLCPLPGYNKRQQLSIAIRSSVSRRSNDRSFLVKAHWARILTSGWYLIAARTAEGEAQIRPSRPCPML